MIGPIVPIGPTADATQLHAARGSPSPSTDSLSNAASATPENERNVVVDADLAALRVALTSGDIATTRTAYVTISGDMNGPPYPAPSTFMNAASVASAAAGLLQAESVPESSAPAKIDGKV